MVYEDMAEAYSVGSRAASYGQGPDECPYPEQTIPRFFWMTGWTNTDNRRVIIESGAIMQWAVDALSSIEEIVTHHDGGTIPLSELLEKIRTVRQKLEEKL